METRNLTLNVEEVGLMCNLLFTAMKASGKLFEEQAQQVQNLSDKLARCHADLAGYSLEPSSSQADDS